MAVRAYTYDRHSYRHATHTHIHIHARNTQDERDCMVQRERAKTRARNPVRGSNQPKHITYREGIVALNCSN